MPVTLSDSLTFSDSFSDETKQETLLVTPPDEKRLNTYYPDADTKVTYVNDKISGGYRIAVAGMNTTKTILAYGTVAQKVRVDGVELTKKDGKPSVFSNSGFCVDENGNTVVWVESADWSTIEFITDPLSDIKITFLGGSVRIPKDYVEKDSKSGNMEALKEANLRMGYTITLPEGKTMEDLNWCWEWSVAGSTNIRTVQGVNYVKTDDNANTWCTNLVITGIPVDTDYATCINAVLKVYYKDSANSGTVDEPRARSVQNVAELIEAEIVAGTSKETLQMQNYVNSLISYMTKE